MLRPVKAGWWTSVPKVKDIVRAIFVASLSGNGDVRVGEDMRGSEELRIYRPAMLVIPVIRL